MCTIWPYSGQAKGTDVTLTRPLTRDKQHGHPPASYVCTRPACTLYHIHGLSDTHQARLISVSNSSSRFAERCNTLQPVSMSCTLSNVEHTDVLVRILQLLTRFFRTFRKNVARQFATCKGQKLIFLYSSSQLLYLLVPTPDVFKSRCTCEALFVDTKYSKKELLATEDGIITHTTQ